MIRRLQESDRGAAVRLLMAAPYLNLYILGNLESLGFAQEFCEFWGDFAGDDLRAVINRYMQGWTLYGRPDADWPSVAALIDEHPVEAQRLQDNPGGIASLLPYLRAYQASKVAVTQLMDLAAEAFCPQSAPDGVELRRATLDDLPALTEFYRDAGSMSRTATGVERPLRDTRLWVALHNGDVVSAALTNAETDRLAMIGGVYTPAAWRNQGLSQAVCSALCVELLATGKQPVLYWENAAAGSVYAKLGFRSRGVWRSVWLQGKQV